MAKDSFCSSITAPINISHDTKICESTCKFLPLYKNEKIVCKNMNTYISVQFEGGTDTKCKFNDETYIVSELRIFNKSIHTYLKKYYDGEILIIHKNSAKPTEILVISVPIIISSVNTAGTAMLEALIQSTYTQAPSDSLSLSNSTGSEKVSAPFVPNIKFDINNLIPITPYYFYKGVFGFQTSLGGCGNPSNILVYSPSQGYVSIDTEINSTFQTLLNPPSLNEYPISKGPILYYNSKGHLHENEDIYIDCQPVNSSTDKVYVPLNDDMKDATELVKELEKLSQGPLAGGIIGILIMLSLYFVIDNSLKIFKGFKAGNLSVRAINS